MKTVLYMVNCNVMAIVLTQGHKETCYCPYYCGYGVLEKHKDKSLYLHSTSPNFLPQASSILIFGITLSFKVSCMTFTVVKMEGQFVAGVSRYALDKTNQEIPKKIQQDYIYIYIINTYRGITSARGIPKQITLQITLS